MPISTQPDAELFVALRFGNSEALGILYDRYGVLVFRLALKVLGNNQDAEDLTQEIFLNLSKTSAFDPSRGSMQTFLLVMTRSRAIDRLRKRRSQILSTQKWQQNLTHSAPLSPMEQLTRQEISQQVRQALQTLPDKHRKVLEMAYYEGKSQSEIAQDLDIPLGTIKSWARQGLINLRKILNSS